MYGSSSIDDREGFKESHVSFVENRSVSQNLLIETTL